MDFRPRFLILIFLAFFFFTHEVSLIRAENHRPKNVHVALRAKWPGTSILLEAGELLSKEGGNLFWNYIDIWLSDKEEDKRFHTAKGCLKKILKHGSSLLGEPLSSVFELSLLLRSASPRLVLYRQLANESLSSATTSYNVLDQEILDPNLTTKILKSDAFFVEIGHSGRKCCWVDMGGQLFFSIKELNGWLYKFSSVEWNSSEKTELFDFDHIHPDSNAGSPVTFLYGALGTNCFEEFHAILEEASRKGKVTYVYRPVLLSGCENVHDCGIIGTQGTMNLGGYGVELALKNMEYKAMDDTSVKKGMILEDPHTEDLTQEVKGFIFSRILERMPDSTHEIMAFRDYLLSPTVSDTLDVWELKDLGHQTAQRIVHASDCIQAMQEINHNFPSVVSSLSRMKLNDTIKDEIIENQRMIPPGKSLMALNGALINIEQIDIYSLVDLVNQEISIGDQFSKLKIPQNYVRRMLSTLSPPVSEVSRIDFRSNHVYYLNNLEEDAKYMRWRSNLNEILMPAFPGQPRYIRKNIFHAVFIFDPASSCGFDSVDMIISLYESNVPIRFGVELYSTNLVNKVKMNDGRLPPRHVENDASIEDDISSLIIQLFIFINENHGALTSFQFLSNVNRLRSESGMSADEGPDLSHVEGAFIETLLPKVKSPPQDTLLRLEKEQIFRRQSDESSMLAFKLGVANLHCPLLMNGLIFEANEDALLNAMNEELPRIQELVYYGHITSHTDVLGKLLSQTGIPRYNPQILFGGKAKQKYISLAASFFENDSVFIHLNYLHSVGTTDDLKPITHLLVVDVTSRKGIKILRSGIHYLMKGSKLGRLAVLFSARPNDDDSLSSLFIKTFEITVSSYSYKKMVLEFLDQLCFFYEDDVLSINAGSENSRNFHEEIFQLADEHNLPSEKLKSSLSEFSCKKLGSHFHKVTQFLSRHVGYHLDNNAIITNGRVTHPIDEDTFLSLDLDLLESVEYRQNVKHIVEMIEEVKWQDVNPDSLTSKFISDVIMFVTSAMSQRDRSSESARFEVLKADYSAVVIPNENSSIHIDAVLDPLSPLGQKISSFLNVLGKYVQPSMRIVLNPLSSLVDLPLKNYYRFALPSLDEFSSNDFSVNGPKAFFSNMPLSKTLTMNLDVPEPWLVEPVVAVHDLDNILLENIGDSKTLSAVFELEALVLTGHCSEKGQEDHPRGLQLILGTRNIPHLVDTLVMANLGYWQLKVSPGIWYLKLAPGRSSDLYSMGDNNEGSGIETPYERITIDDFRGKLVRFEVVKRRGKEHEKLLISTNDGQPKSNYQTHQHAWNSNLIKWASNIIGRTEETKTSQKTIQGRHKVLRYGETINIFSVASGHLYERFLKIMILSVLKNTHRPIKFWFIKNYLSPPFKDVIPEMAKEYDFGYELITYKWPSWLHKQKEKQRIIWAYKILFLDVIFPLSLQKVIFVDADQVVRADMGDLYDMDIDGNPLAYTPFCDNNRDMDGYRFWRQGFWREHLQGKPYHISALYVVDLAKFRETAAGDNLRVFYETLSKDPNSLSNLDQDLPNYAQHTVPIFSLPQEWLWCESWCGNSTKSRAKTIDLCNNPMTKEPKLQGAKRIVSEWVGLDEEARRFTAKVMGEEFEEVVAAVAEEKENTDGESVAEL